MALVLALVGVGMGIAGGATAAAMLSGALVVALASCLWRLNRAVLCPRCEGYRATPLELRAETGRGGEVKRYRITVDCPGCDFKASGRVRAGESSLGQLSSFVGRARVATGLATALIFWKVFAVGLGVFLVFLLFGGLLLALLIFSILARTTSSRRSYSNWSRSSSGGAWAPSSFKGSYSSGGWTSGSSSSLGGGSSGGGGAGRGF